MAPSNASSADPFRTLLDAHQRIEVELGRLDHLGLDPAALDVVRSVLEFFAGPGARHHDEEERSLFPRLRPLPEFAMMLPAIEAQHEMIDGAHAALRNEVTKGSPGGPARLRVLAARFAEMHRGHIIAEERGLFPLAASALTDAAKVELARELAARIA